MPEVIATWEDFSGGHWGNVGPSKAPDNAFGGVNMLVANDGTLIPACSSRYLQLSSGRTGKVWGMFWAWGADGRVYYIQQHATSTLTVTLYRFSPDPDNLPNTVGTVSTMTFVPTVDPDWVEVGETIYLTEYGIFTYQISSTNTSIGILTGSYGNAAAGRSIAMYGDRLMVGGVSDIRFGTHPNRIHFSGDDTNNVVFDRTAWETANFFDIGNDGDQISGMYNLRDYLVVVMDDQSMYLINGTPPSPPDGSLSARRVYGFNKGSGGLTAFRPSHAAVDPSQTRIWMFDHTTRSPARFNGAAMSRVQQFGAPHASRTGTDLTEGALAMIGGPDEFIAHGVAVGRNAGEQTVSHRLELVRLRGIYSLVTNDVIASRG